MSNVQDDLVLALLCDWYANRPVSVDWATVDMAALVECARAHGVLRQVYCAAGDDPSAPAALVDGLRRECLIASAQSCALAGELARLSREFRSRQIPTLFVKGPALSAQLYGSPAARSSLDIDLLVRRPDIGNARSLLEALGYVAVSPLPPHPSDKHIIFTDPRSQLVAELHWALWPEQQEVVFDEEALWTDSVTVEVGGEAVATLCLEDTILHLAAHGRTHRWSHWKWVCDMAQAAALPVDWTLLLERAARRGWQRTLLVSFEVAHRALGIELPEGIRGACARDPRIGALAEAIAATPDPSAFRNDESGVLQEQFRYRDTMRARMGFAARKLAGAWRGNDSNAERGGGNGLARPIRLYRLYGFRWIREIL